MTEVDYININNIIFKLPITPSTINMLAHVAAITVA